MVATTGNVFGKNFWQWERVRYGYARAKTGACNASEHLAELLIQQNHGHLKFLQSQEICMEKYR